MSDLYNDQEIEQYYAQTHDATIAELNKMIISLRTRVHYLENRLEESEKIAENGMTNIMKWRFDKLEENNKSLKNELKEREKTGVSREFERELQKMIKEKEDLLKELEFYKSKVPDWVIINRENKKKPTRKGGIPK